MDIPFLQQVRARLLSGERRGPLLVHGRTPAVLRMLEFPALPVAMPPSVLFKIASGKQGERPPIPQNLIERLPELLDQPAAVFRQEHSDSLIVICHEVDSAGSPIAIVVRPNQADGLNRVNVITTAYGKSNADDWFRREADRACWIADKTNPRLPLPGHICNMTGAHETEGSGRIILGHIALGKYRAETAAKALADVK